MSDSRIHFDRCIIFYYQVVEVGVGMAFLLVGLMEIFTVFGGAHMNPAVTISMVLVGKTTIVRGRSILHSLGVGHYLFGVAWPILEIEKINSHWLKYKDGMLLTKKKNDKQD